jgi:hypothetical protein
MFAKIRGRRTTALATTLAVVVGLAITPAFTATAAEGDPVDGVQPIAIVEPAATAVAPEVAATPAASEEPAVAQAPAPVEEVSPAVEVGSVEAQSPIAPLGARMADPAAEPGSAGVSPMAAPAATDFGIQPATIGPFLAGQNLAVQFTAPWWGVDLWRSTGLPPGLSLSKSGFLTGNVSSAGTYSFVIIGQSCFFICADLTSRTYTVTFGNPAPVVTTNNLLKATVGAAYSEQLTATGAGTMTYRVSQGSLPAGLALSSTGLISGIPTFESHYTGSNKVDFSVLANNGTDSAAKALSITVTTPKPEFGNTALATATVGVPYTQALPLATGYGTLTFAFLSGDLPPGLTLGSNGVITGTPLYAATYKPSQTFNFNARVSGPGGFSNQPFKLILQVDAPTITTTTLPEAWLTKAYSQPITTTGFGVELEATGLPAGLTLHATRTAGYSITGTPTAQGEFFVTLTAKNAGGPATATIALTVNAAPVITTDSVPVATVGSAYSTIIAATGKNVTFTATTADSGVQISTTGELTWTPSSEQAVSVEVTATNNSGSHTRTFLLESYAVPTIAATVLDFGVVGKRFAQSVDFTGLSAETTVTGGTLPAGLNLRTDGRFQGKPTTPGTYSFEVTATNPVGSASQLFEVTVYDVPAINTWSLDRATVGGSYLDAIQFTGLDAEAALVGGALPTGLVLNADGTITGTPTEEGAFRFWVQVANPAGSVIRGYSIRSFEVPEITTTSLDSAVTGVAFRDRIRATGDQAVFTVVRGSLPDGLTLTKRGVLKGTATESGTFTFTVRAKNPVGADRQQFTITVTAPAVQLSVSSIIRGNTMTVTGSGFKSGDQLELWLHSTPVLLGTATATGGTFTSTVVIPANTPAGLHHLVVVGAQSGTHSVPLTIALPAAVAAAPAAPQASSQSRGSQQAAAEPDEETTVSDSTQVEEVAAPAETEVEAELETLDQPVADGEKPVAPAADWTGLAVGAFVLLLAALLVLFLLWRRRRALEG